MSRSSLPARLLFFSLGALLLAIPSAAFAGPHPHKHPKQQIADLEEQWRVATLAADTATMDRMLSDDYVGISWTGIVNTKTTQLDRTRTNAINVQSMTLSDVKIKLLGPGAAIVTCRADVEGTSDSAPLHGAYRYTRVYQRLPSGAWKITNFEATRIPNRPLPRATAASTTPPTP